MCRPWRQKFAKVAIIAMRSLPFWGWPCVIVPQVFASCGYYRECEASARVGSQTGSYCRVGSPGSRQRGLPYGNPQAKSPFPVMDFDGFCQIQCPPLGRPGSRRICAEAPTAGWAEASFQATFGTGPPHATLSLRRPGSFNFREAPPGPRTGSIRVTLSIIGATVGASIY